MAGALTLADYLGAMVRVASRGCDRLDGLLAVVARAVVIRRAMLTCAFRKFDLPRKPRRFSANDVAAETPNLYVGCSTLIAIA